MAGGSVERALKLASNDLGAQIRLKIWKIVGELPSMGNSRALA
ncbi:hypothetical protein N752_15485 [Desulforamulus aquiferis]|nr:hypothetical protein [Desulforamulus aquiferis]RYD04244.1 hypothetical protein N752_15485 [Desulforamulus aquiferis]